MKKGFTLIELLVVIAIIALLSTLSVVALNSARVKSRDARRLSDIKQIRTALEMYADSHDGRYPYHDVDEFPILGLDYLCLDSSGFSASLPCSGTIYMASIPKDPVSTRKYDYYSDDGVSYTIAYQLEGSPDVPFFSATPASMGY